MNHASFRLLRCLQGSWMVNLPDSWTFTISILSGKYTLRYIRIQIVKYGESVQTELIFTEIIELK
jgi:hypothetical protein